MATGTVAACYHFCWRCCCCRYGVFSQMGLPPFHFSNPGRGSEAEPSADGCPGENFWNSICDLVHFDAIWWQLFVGRRARYICNCAIKIEPICQSQCHRDCTAVLPLLSNEHALKSGTFGVPGLVLLGRGTTRHKSGTSREIRDGWQRYWRNAALERALQGRCDVAGSRRSRPWFDCMRTSCRGSVCVRPSLHADSPPSTNRELPLLLTPLRARRSRS